MRMIEKSPWREAVSSLKRFLSRALRVQDESLPQSRAESGHAGGLEACGRQTKAEAHVVLAINSAPARQCGDAGYSGVRAQPCACGAECPHCANARVTMPMHMPMHMRMHMRMHFACTRTSRTRRPAGASRRA